MSFTTELPTTAHRIKNLTTMSQSIKLLEGLSDRHCERFDPAKMGGLPPMWFVPESDLDMVEKRRQESRENRDHRTRLKELQALPSRWTGSRRPAHQIP